MFQYRICENQAIDWDQEIAKREYVYPKSRQPIHCPSTKTNRNA